MQIVIDIDENVFTRLFDNGIEDYGIVNDDLFAIAKSIRKGIPLPKGHGDLIDRGALKADCNEQEVYYDEDYYNEYCGFSLAQVECADVIVKADEEEKK